MNFFDLKIHGAIFERRGFIGLVLPAGTSDILFQYAVPMFKEGVVISVCSGIVLAGLVLCHHRRTNFHATRH